MSRWWGFRIAAIIVGCLPFVVLEASIRVLDLGKPDLAQDPFLNLSQLEPLFEEAATNQFAIPERRYRLFAPASFAMPKEVGVKRIFSVGGSTTQGEPYGPTTSFPEWLRICLETADSAHRYESINCGGLSYASYRVLPIVREILAYEPDLIVIYTGQNEFLEARELQGWKSIPQPLQQVGSSLLKLRTPHAIRLLVSPTKRDEASSQVTRLQREVDALLDYQGGLAKYRRISLDREAVIASFRWNLDAMLVACREANVPCVVIVPTVNLKDCPPFKIEVDPELNDYDANKLDRLWTSLQQADTPRSEVASAASEILALDNEHAGAHYVLGQLAYVDRDWEKARIHMTAAKDFDVCPLRAITAIQQTVRDVCRSHGIPCLDADQFYSQRSPQQIVGREWLLDHIHPTIEGHQALGQAIFDLIRQESTIGTLAAISDENRDSAYREHLASLGEPYFQRGKQRLEGLMLWTQGRAKKLNTRTD